jgi:uncharacterized damage-inducible protein DinB
MTKQYFLELAQYNIWANYIVHGWFEKINDEQWEQPVVSSFESIAATALHIAGAETIWLDRLNKAVSPVWLPAVFKGNKKDIMDLWKKASVGLKAFVENFDEAALTGVLSFKRINGEAYTMAYYQVFTHIFNHSSYHRGQLVTLLRQVGFTHVGSTDLLGFFRK